MKYRNMSDIKWRDELDLLIEKNLNELVKSTKEFDYAISKSKDKSKAQIWVALALLNEKINRMSINNTKYDKKISSEEINNIISTLEKM